MLFISFDCDSYACTLVDGKIVNTTVSILVDCRFQRDATECIGEDDHTPEKGTVNRESSVSSAMVFVETRG